MANGIKVVRDTFAQACQRHDRALLVLLQADMFDPTYTPDFATDSSAFQPLVQTLVDESSAFDGQVYLVNGDSHIYAATSLRRPVPPGWPRTASPARPTTSSGSPATARTTTRTG